ncbi:MAG: hypothetical protein IJC74_02315 [Clostridia bacterium]|nr:hypothetical protein [Clostridia bacterium]
MSIAEKLTTIAENQEKVFEAGKKAEYDKFWDAYQYNGKRTQYIYAFSGGNGYGWNDDSFYPKYDMQPAHMLGMFSGNVCTNLKQRFEECGITLDTSNCKYFKSAFENAHTSELPKLNLSKMKDCAYLFSSSSIKKLDIIFSESTSINSTSAFSIIPYLTDLTIEGVLGSNNFSISGSTQLTHESLMNIVNCLKDYSDYTGTTVYKVTLGTTNLNKLTDEEKAIATEKGWTLV